MSKAIKKNQLYSSLWESCDQLRGGMDASQYKDYVLTLLFVKYVSDKATGSPYDAIEVPEGGSFTDMIALKNKPNIGEDMDKVVAKLAEANGLQGVITNAHFNDEAKLGRGKEKVDTLTSLVGVFQNLDFSRNSANDDDLIGDAYEYLMRKFATESGKSKGQFYTPAEVARVLAQVVEVGSCTNRNATVYDPACGSGSLLIRVLAAAPFELAGYGQEKDNTTAGLAKMNAVLHGRASVSVHTGNTFADPHNFDTGKNTTLQRFDYVVANPPVLDEELEERPGALPGTLSGLRRRAAPEERRLRLATAHPRLAQGHGQGGGDPAARRAHARQRRGDHTKQHRGRAPLGQSRHRASGQPLLRHGHTRLHRGG